MQYSEELTWILDKPGTTLQNQEEKFRENIAFVHSLGLKCDRVGWSKLALSNPRTPDILHSISEFCKKNGWHARGLYTRRYTDVQGDWYELVPTPFKDNTSCDRIETVTETSGVVHTRVIRAFHEPRPEPKEWGDEIYVPERFRNFCIRNHIDGLDFCWAKDIGKYEAEQYFHVYGTCLIPKIAVDFDLNEPNKELIAAAGGWLPKIADVFHQMQQICLPDCYLSEDMPKNGIAYAYIPRTHSCAGRHTILIHKEVVRSLLQEKILPVGALRPAPVVPSLPGGYSLQTTQPVPRPAGGFQEDMLLAYEKLKNTPRPVRRVSEKDALKLLRLAKKERKADFRKPLPKAACLMLPDTDYSPLAPYYAVTDGGFLSDE